MNIVVSWCVYVCQLLESSVVYIRITLVEVVALECQPCEELEREPKMGFEVDLKGTDQWNHTILSTLGVFASVAQRSCELSIWNATVGTNVVVVANRAVYVDWMTVAVSPNGAVFVVVVVADARNQLSCVLRNWLQRSE